MTDHLYYTRTFWSPDRRYLVTAHFSDGAILALQDDNGIEWEPASEQEVFDDFGDDDTDGYCQCGSIHDDNEGVCACCGLEVDPNE